jgi:lysophospholipase L1-like esterase
MSSTRAALLLLALFALAPARAGASEPTLYVGDSLGVGTVGQLSSTTVGNALDGDTRIGRTSTEGIVVLRSRLRQRHKVVVFDLGTNDSSADLLGHNLRRARTLTGDRPLIVFTLNKPGAQPFNSAIRAFARASDNVFLIDWHSTASSRHLLAGDGIHASPTGYRRRAALVASLIRASRQARWASARALSAG